MLLVMDVGNTNIVLGVFREARLEHSWRVSTIKERTADEYGVLCHNLFELAKLPVDHLEAVVISSVVPPLRDRLEALSRRYLGCEPVFVEPENQKIMPVRYNPPADVGADRIVNALAAVQIYGGPAIVVDFGTATTFDVVSRGGEYMGGVICPGVRISAEALFTKAAKLPRIEIKKPSRLVGDSTTTSMQSGIFYGYVSLVEGILRRMLAEIAEAHVVATGGLAQLIGSYVSEIERIDEDLTLHGLHIFYRKLKDPGESAQGR
jgi:type III pantothenate kinase